tara:strand:+ start:1446 stop:2747 length:1302 start_codon:yes stop_codon:yes gene_type:complete
MNIFIPIETTHREMLYKTFFCHFLAKKGFKCFLGSKHNINYLINNESDFLYLDKGYHLIQSDKLYKKIKKNNGTIVSLDEEGAIDFVDGSTLQKRYSKNLFKNSATTFMWGVEQYNLVKKNFYNSNKVFITGHPRFELLKSNYHFLYKREAKEINERFGKFNLINTNMGFGNNILGDEFVIRNYKERYKKIKNIIKSDKAKLDLMVGFALKLAESSNRNIIFRPHPEENQNYYKKVFKDHRNIHVVYEGSVFPWILASEFLVHPDCTTAIECLISGKMPLSLMPKNINQDFVTHLPLKASTCFDSSDDLVSFILNEKVEKTVKNKLKTINRFFSVELDSNESIAQILLDLSIEKRIFPKKLSFKTRTGLKLKLIKSFIFPVRFSNELSKQKLSGLDLDKIQLISKRIKKNQKDFDNIKIKKLNEFLYSFSSND